jgi:hypothetical protein
LVRNAIDHAAESRSGMSAVSGHDEKDAIP